MDSSEPSVILGLDLSTKPGFAILKNGIRIVSGTVRPARTLSADKHNYPFNYIQFAHETVEALIHTVYTHLNFQRIKATDVTHVVIEETTASSQNYSQKILEFIHFAFLTNVQLLYPEAKVCYIRDGVWKSITGARLNDQEKKNNAKISRLKAQKKAANPDKKRIIVRKDKEGNPVRAVTPHDAYIRAANQIFGLNLGREQEDEAAALLIAEGYRRGAPICDGTTESGVVKKEEDNVA